MENVTSDVSVVRRADLSGSQEFITGRKYKQVLSVWNPLKNLIKYKHFLKKQALKIFVLIFFTVFFQ